MLSIIFLAASLQASAPVVVSPMGSDSNRGTEAAPVRTLSRAIELAKRGEVWIRRGVYILPDSIRLGPAHDGLTIRNYPGERPVLSGGASLQNWAKVLDPSILKRLPAESKDFILQAALPFRNDEMHERGMQVPVTPVFPEIFASSVPLTLARWPNGIWAHTEQILGGRPGEDSSGKFVFNHKRLERWGRANQAFVEGYFNHDWADHWMKVQAVDVVRHRITVQGSDPYGFLQGRRFFIANLLEELAHPGEYFIDSTTGIAYVYPTKDWESKQIQVSRLWGPIFDLLNTDGISIVGLTLECGRGDGLRIENGQSNRIESCLIRDFGNSGIQIEGGRRNEVDGCTISDVGAEGVGLTGGDRSTLSPASHRVLNNHILRFGRLWRTYQAGIRFEGVGQTIAHNLIEDAPHSGIIFRNANDCNVEFNEIKNVCYETDDAGAILSGRDWTERGNTIRFNLISHIVGVGPMGTRGIYLDDGMSGIDVFGNIINEASVGIQVGGGRDNRLQSNLIVNCPISIGVDDRGLNWMADELGESGDLKRRLRAVPFTSGVWAARYPELSTILSDHPAYPKRNVVADNVFIGSTKVLFADQARQQGTIRNNTTISGTPRFDPSRLEAATRAHRAGVRIETTRIGPLRGS